MSSENEERGFTIVDRRGAESGEPAEAAAPAEEAAPAKRPPEGQAAPGALPEVDLPSFLLSLATSALYHLGLVADPQTGERAERNLPLARQTIDTLALLETKTRGNLTDEESELLTNLLTELRMRYVESSS